jgi:5'-nucleotidase (lipoprotein e(P4) family)
VAATCAAAQSAPRPTYEEGRQKLAATAFSQRGVETALISEDVYRQAARALDAAVADPGEARLPEEQTGAPGPLLPPAVVLDVDETVLDNSPFQAFQSLSGSGYTNGAWDDWVRARAARPVPGAVAFTQAAAAKGVSVFYVTNRACPKATQAPAAGVQPSDCPQKADTMAVMQALGFARATDPAAFLFKDENKDWNSSDKVLRRQYVAQNHRIVMLLGDQLTDFTSKATAAKLWADFAETPVSEAARKAGPGSAYAGYVGRLGTRWFLLPNPQYGFWEDRFPTTVNKTGALETLGFAPGLRFATWNAEWFMRPEEFDIVAAKPCSAGGGNPVSRTLPCDVANPASPNYARRSADDVVAMQAYADRLGADVLALEEVDGPSAASLLLPKGYRFCFTERGETTAGGAYEKPVQDIGLAIRDGLGFVCREPWKELGLPDNRVRWGAVATLYPGTAYAVDILAVHLKSGCPTKTLDAAAEPCPTLRQQAALLKAWLAARGPNASPLVMLGDFNRVLEFASPTAQAKSLWANLDAGDGSERDLTGVTEGMTYGKCEPHDSHNAYIDQIVLSRSLALRAGPATHEAFDAGDITAKRKLSDHCAVVVRLGPLLPPSLAPPPPAPAAFAKAPKAVAKPPAAAAGRLTPNADRN